MTLQNNTARLLLFASALLSALTIAARAEEFDCNQEVTFPACSHIDKTVGVLCSGNTIHGYALQHNFVQYAFNLSCGGSFVLDVLYATAGSSAYWVYVNNEGTLGSGFDGPFTGGNTPDYQKWSPSITVKLVAGRNTLRFDNTRGTVYVALPYISMVRLRNVSPAKNFVIQPCTSGICEGNYACVDNGGDNQFYCKPRCRIDADCANANYPQLRCFPHKGGNDTPAVTMVCNDRPSFVYQPKK